ncbi:uncharacterized protein [Coffea arabica]|uniref:DNA helicase Pif1-like 2B domain-containing protein n=1 Tax=Coffea arabica TaxID=13443 RepID=A0ABM4X7L2_COFAR
MLTKWFEINQSNVSVRNLTFVEFPSKWTWKQNRQQWEFRLQGRCIGRLPYAHAHSGERYYLRTFLHKIRGAQSYEHLKTINGIVHPTIKAAYAALGLLNDDNEWNEALAEASTWAFAKNYEAYSVYLNLRNSYKNSTYLKEHAILAPKMGDVHKLNNKMLSMLPDQSHAYMSVDTFCNTEGDNVENMNPPKMLHSLNFPELSNHFLELKEGTPIILFRNLNQSEGHCNGTRLVVTRMGDKVLKAEVKTGSNSGDLVLIPRISLMSQSARTPFPIKRRQFPMKVAFAMTINKSQGQTLKNVGVYLPKPVFSHGQLYVALSCATSPVGLKILIVNRDNDPWDYTKNIVYHEIFDSL